VSNAGPFVINLCSSTTPMALEQTKLGELKQRFTFFVSRRREDGRERFRLHMGYFDTENEAEEWLAVVRDIYPGAWTGEAPGKRLREREAAAAAVNAAAGPAASNMQGAQPPAHVLAGIAKVQESSTRLRTPPAAAALDMRRNEFAPPAPTAEMAGAARSVNAMPEKGGPFGNGQPARWQAATTLAVNEPSGNPQWSSTGPSAIAAGQSEFSVTFEPTPPLGTPAYSPPQPDLAPIMFAPALPASAPDAARSALVAASASAQAAVRMASPPPVLVVPTLQEAPPELPPGLSIPVLSAPTLSAPALSASPAAAAASAAISASTADTIAQQTTAKVAAAPKVTPPVFAAPPAAPTVARGAPAPRAPLPPARSTAPAAKPVQVVAKAPASAPPVKQAAKLAPQAFAKSSKLPNTGRPQNSRTAADEQSDISATGSRRVSTDELSNVGEVLAALDETGQTRQMPAVQSPAPAPSVPASTKPSMSDTQILKILENRRADGSLPSGNEPDDGISFLRPDDTGTVRALKEAVTTNQPVAFAVQLKFSVQPIELSEVPPLAIFSAYTLYTVEGSREGRKWFGLRLGFFTDAISAKQVAYYVRSEFASVAVVPVSPQERTRANESNSAGKLQRAGAPLPKRNSALPADEFKLIDTMESPALSTPARAPAKPVAAAPAPRPAAPAPAPKPQAKAAPPPPPKQKSKTPGKVRAKDKRTPQSLEETLEILGADQLEIDNGRGELLNDTGVRHLKVSLQKSSPFTRLLDRLSERVNKP